ncbi:carboxypeptidase-like regulatory domain-containing protein [Pedobacter sp. UC225_65]|uniref:carboxypeptidase-like regulatory domain-containing protein n=1 Tax=Pedobacter sp. UC225_65 TaxID=3350173 RepID=UPI00366CB827
MIKQLFLTLLIFVSTSIVASAQNTYHINGTIKDKTGALPGAVVYVAGYKMTTVSNNDGKFSLPNLAPGNYDILIQMIGYVSYKKNIILSDKSVDLDVLLQESTTTLNEIVVKPDPKRAGYLQLFKELFIGLSANSQSCTLLNPQESIFNYDRETSVLSGKSLEFLVIENKALGYRVKYLVDNFEYNYKSRIFYYEGQPFFEELKGSNSKQKKWAKAREVAYNRSTQHFFKSLYENRVKEEGFVINKLVEIPNPNRKPDSVINANVKRLTAGNNGLIRTLTFNGSDSLSYWLRQRSESKVMNTLIRADVLVDTLVKVFNKDIKMMNYQDALYIIYKNEMEPGGFAFSGHRQTRPMDMPEYQISVIYKLQPKAYFYANGGIFDPRSLLYQGYWAYEKVGDMVPMDYTPPVKTKK